MNHSVARIMHLRRLLLIHSYLYYVLDDPVIPDHVWQTWADELVGINQDIGFYDEAFKDWDGSTGYHLPFEDKWVVNKALQIRRIYGDRHETQTNNYKHQWI